MPIPNTKLKIIVFVDCSNTNPQAIPSNIPTAKIKKPLILLVQICGCSSQNIPCCELLRMLSYEIASRCQAYTKLLRKFHKESKFCTDFQLVQREERQGCTYLSASIPPGADSW